MQYVQAGTLYLIISNLPGEVHVVDMDRDGGHPLLCFPEVVGERGHFTLGHY